MIYRLLLDQALTVRSTPGKDYAVACETRFAQTACASFRRALLLRFSVRN